MERQEASQQHRDAAIDLLAFDFRYKEADADRVASFPNSSPQEAHASTVHEQQNGNQTQKRRLTSSAKAGLASAKALMLTSRTRL